MIVADDVAQRSNDVVGVRSASGEGDGGIYDNLVHMGHDVVGRAPGHRSLSEQRSSNDDRTILVSHG